MSHEILLLLIGAGIALVSSIVTALVQHLLNLRAEKIKKRWEKEAAQSQALQSSLTEGVQIHLDSIKEKLRSDLKASMDNGFHKLSGEIRRVEELRELIIALMESQARERGERSVPGKNPSN
jgi:predicted GTPase